jgi:hypothetical protein
MPLCPQITNTPITVLLTADFTTTNVVPVTAASTTQVAAVQATADGKNSIYRQATVPTGGVYVTGDLWFDTDDNNQIYRFVSGAFSALQLGGNALANINANAITAGSIDASVITVSNINAGNISAGTISGIAYNNGGGTFQVSAAGALIASSATITGAITATSGSFTGSITSTSGSIGGFTLSSNSLTGTNFSMFSASGNGNFATLGCFSLQAGLLGGSGAITATGSITAGTSLNGASVAVTGAATSATVSTTGNITANGDLFAAGHTTTSNAANGFVFTTGGRIARSTASSQRYKENIVDLDLVPQLDSKKLLDIPVRAFSYKEGYLNSSDDRHGTLIPGFIAEEVDAIYPIAADYADGPESWNDRMLIPGMLALIQSQEKRIKALEEKLTTNL